MRTIKLSRDQFRAWRANHATDRETIRTQILASSEGETCRIQSPMGRLLGTVRGENNISGARPMGIQSNAPPPDLCACRDFTGTPKGAHHPVCQFNTAWEQSKGITIKNVPSPTHAVTHMHVSKPMGSSNGVQHFSVPTQAGGGVHSIPTPVQPAVLALVPPDQCQCRHFLKPKEADPLQHHFVCEHFEKWKIAHPTPTGEVVTRDTEPPTEFTATAATSYALVDLNSGNELRDATSEEVEESRAEEIKSGAPLVTNTDGTFAVVPRHAES